MSLSISHGIGIAMAVLLAVACAEKKDPIFEDPLGDLSFDEQAKEAAHEFLAIAKANATKSCPRPVLRGTPLPGKAADDIIAAVEQEGASEPCVAALEFIIDFQSFIDLCADNSGASEDGFPRRRLCVTGPPDLNPGSDSEADFNRRRASCARDLEAVGRAVAHEDACSPYLPGVRYIEDHGKKLPYLATLITAVALDRARLGETREAAESLLDLIRFSQDLHRGGTSLAEVGIAREVSTAAISALERVLDRPKPLGAPLLAQIDRELEALIATEPSPSDFLKGTSAHLATYHYLPMMLGPKWSPPGKTIGKPYRPIAKDVADGRRWLVREHRNRLAADRACGPEDSDYSCSRRLTAYGEEALDTANAKRGNPLLWPSWVRDLPMFIAFGVNKEEYADRVHEHGQTQFYLGALRLLARYRALAEQTGACPGIETFDRPDFADARVDPYSGKPLRVQEIGAGRFLLSSPEKLELGPYPNDAITIRVKCPFPIEKKPPADGGI